MKIADISHYQGNINWGEARKELELVIFRASVGSSKDNKYLSYAAECQIPFGVYHYVKAGNEAAAKKEAAFFYECATANGNKPLFFVADIEYSAQTSQTTKGVTSTFAAELRRLGAKKLGLYISQDRYSYADHAAYDFIWIPRYGKNDGTMNEAYKPKYPCDMWQYTSVGKVKGINANVDLDVLYGDKDLSWFVADGVPAAKAPVPQASSAPATLGSRTLRQGSIGEDVKELQRKLNEVFDVGLVEDGEFGAKTAAVVKELQKKSGLTVDGIYGTKSHAALMAAKMPVAQESPAAPNYALLGKKTLRQNSKGDDVKELQQALNAALKACLTVDGIYGAKTTQAVKNLQKKKGLSVDGVYGPKSHAALMSLL